MKFGIIKDCITSSLWFLLVFDSNEVAFSFSRVTFILRENFVMRKHF